VEAKTEIATVLVVDDDRLFLNALQRTRGSIARVLVTMSSQEALAIAASQPLDLAIVDLRLGDGMSGLALLRDLKREYPRLSVALCSAYLDIVTTRDAMQSGAATVVAKPATLKEIVQHASGLARATASEDLPTLAEMSRNYVARVLHDHANNVSATARALGISRNTLKRKLGEPVPARGNRR
jgi:two-component system, response regulator RegA